MNSTQGATVQFFKWHIKKNIFDNHYKKKDNSIYVEKHLWNFRTGSVFRSFMLTSANHNKFHGRPRVIF